MVNLTREHLILVELLLRSVSHSFGALALFAPSKAVATVPDWRGEVAGVVWVVSTLPMLFYVLANPALLRRRIPRAEQIPRQKIIKALFGLGGMVMYAGSFLSWGFDYNLASTPIPVALLGDLGVFWILTFLPFLLAVIIWRLTNEERYLRTHLPGYQDYCARVTHRLLPFIW